MRPAQVGCVVMVLLADAAVGGATSIGVFFDADATTTQGQRRWQVVRVPQYTTATLSR